MRIGILPRNTTGLLTAAVISFLCIHVQADDTATFRLDQAGMSMEHVVRRDQLSLGDCYGHVSAELIDAWRFSHGDQNYAFQTSGVFAALYSDGTEGGSIASGTKFILKNGSCSVAEINQDFGHAVPDTVIHNMSDYHDKYLHERNLISNPPEPKEPTTIYIARRDRTAVADPAAFDQEVKHEELGILNRTYSVGLNLYSKKSGDGDIIEDTAAAAALNVIDPKTFLTKVLPKNCDPSKRLRLANPPEVIETDYVYGKNTEAIARTRALEIEYLLASPRAQPVGIKFCSKALASPHVNGVKRWYYVAALKIITVDLDIDNCDAHAVMIYGRRLSQSGTPQFLVRNSWGPYCPKIWDNTMVQCETQVINGKNFNTGDFWADEVFLMKATFGHFYLENRSEK